MATATLGAPAWRWTGRPQCTVQPTRTLQDLMGGQQRPLQTLASGGSGAWPVRQPARSYATAAAGVGRALSGATEPEARSPLVAAHTSFVAIMRRFQTRPSKQSCFPRSVSNEPTSSSALLAPLDISPTLSTLIDWIYGILSLNSCAAASGRASRLFPLHGIAHRAWWRWPKLKAPPLAALGQVRTSLRVLRLTTCR